MLPSRPVRVLLLERDGGVVHQLLARDPSLYVRVTLTFEAASAALRDAPADALVVALGQPTVDEGARLKQLLRGLHGVPSLVMFDPVDDERVVGLIKAGAGGYLFRSDAPFLVTALRELLRGGAPMSAAISRLVMQRARRSSATMAAVNPHEGPATKLLTPRQREILKLLQFGHSYEAIGVALSLSVNTVRSHVRVIYDRLGAASKVEAVMVALELGILEKPGGIDADRPPA